jgi:hypothetical protein
VPHFKCYKIGVKTCTDAAGTVVDCSTITKFAKNTIQMNLHDQFGNETVFLGAPKLLCAPVVKQIVGQTTTTATIQTTTSTTVSTTTTTIPCRDISQPGTPAVCAGDCPPGTGLACVFIPGGLGCTCELPCALQGPVPQVCNNQFCPKAGQQCLTTAVNPCGCCYPPAGGPCASASDCCFGNCVGSVCQ